MKRVTAIRRPLNVNLETGVDAILERLNDGLRELWNEAEELRRLAHVVEREVRLDTPGSVAGAFPLRFVSGLPPGQRASSLLVAWAKNTQDETAVFVDAVFPSWSNAGDGQTLVLHHLSGLSASSSYLIRFWVRGE